MSSGPKLTAELEGGSVRVCRSCYTGNILKQREQATLPKAAKYKTIKKKPKANVLSLLLNAHYSSLNLSSTLLQNKARVYLRSGTVRIRTTFHFG